MHRGALLDTVLNVTFENLRQCLTADFRHGIAGCHVVADVQVANDVHWNEGLGAVAETGVGQGARAPRHIA
ncbi:hypothetical protein ASE07_20585 [Noviherbaspirillum sp. Root189]|nr:hypothetical protein ASE07_20585 [Noviherbaspirillum sp. Root189]